MFFAFQLMHAHNLRRGIPCQNHRERDASSAIASATANFYKYSCKKQLFLISSLIRDNLLVDQKVFNQ